MSTRKITLLIFAAALLAEPLFAQQKGDSSPCMAEYENHNQIDYGPLVVQEVKGTITDPQEGAVSKVCVGIFTEKDRKLIATTESDAEGKFSLQSVPPGRYRLVVKTDPLCAANVPLQLVKSQKKKQVLHVHVKPPGLDSCSYAELGTESAVSPSKSSQIETDTVDPNSTSSVHNSQAPDCWATSSASSAGLDQLCSVRHHFGVECGYVRALHRKGPACHLLRPL